MHLSAFDRGSSLHQCETAMEELKITLLCLFGGSTGDDEVCVHPLQLCVHSLTPFLSTLNPSTPVLPAAHLSSRTSLSDDSPRSFPPLLPLRNAIFHFCWVCMVSRALCSPSLPLSSFSSSSSSSASSPSFISPDTKPRKLADVQGKEKQNGQSVNSWHLGLALSARTK